jgi:hypothetical protein
MRLCFVKPEKFGKATVTGQARGLALTKASNALLYLDSKLILGGGLK